MKKRKGERVLVLIKPHLLLGELSIYSARHSHEVVVEIINRYLKAGLSLKAPIRFVKLSKEKVKKLYRQHSGKPFFSELVRDMTKSECVAMIWCGKKAIKKIRRINGATDPAKAEAGTLRHEYGDRNNLSNNAVHGSENPEQAKKEIKLIFG